jgi:hypothetical protein
MKKKSERFKHKRHYLETITLLSDRNITINHGVGVIQYFSHLIKANNSSNTQFINGAKKLEAHFVYADFLFLVSR